MVRTDIIMNNNMLICKQMMRGFFQNKLLMAILMALPVLAGAQDEGLRYENYVYKSNIRTVRFHAPELFLAQPIVELGRASQLVLSFDDLDADVKDYTYSIIHCDMNWRPSDLSEMEYNDGYAEDRIDRFSFSFKTLQNFTHYELFLPHENMNWTKSGNYLLKVYEDEDEKTLVITRRFMVVDPKVRITAQVSRPALVSKIQTHQEIDFSADFERFPIKSPQQEIRAVVLQNGRWDNAVSGVAPLFVRLNTMMFDYQDKIVFPAGKEFRFLDFRSLRYRNEQIISIDQFPDRFEVLLGKDIKLSGKVYLNSRDINGNYVVETLDQDNPDLASEYAQVLFSLYSPEPYYEEDVYLVGAFNGWQLMPEYKMVYNPAVNGYVVKTPLKQGYYNYAYAVAPRKLPQTSAPLNLSEIEGDWHEAENEYTILLYYRPFGGRYDELVGSLSFSSTR